MKVQLNEEQWIKGKARDPGEVVIVRKDEGQRLIDEGVANLVIEAEENRVVSAPENRTRFANHTRYGR